MKSNGVSFMLNLALLTAKIYGIQLVKSFLVHTRKCRIFGHGYTIKK